MLSAYISKLMELAQRDSNVLHLLADSGTSYDEFFRRNFPKQIYNFGISEEHMVSAAAGMAAVGKTPFVFTAGAFLAYRCLEFIRDDVCFQNLNVKIAGMGSGLAWSSLGPTHHTTEDVAVLRALPNLMILSPATPRQVGECLEKAYAHRGPVYIRIGMSGEREFFPEDYHMTGYDRLRQGGEITIFSTGGILAEADEAARRLAERHIPVTLINVHTIKPFHEEEALAAVKSSRLIVTIEEHNVSGGLGSILSELIADRGIPVKLLRLGLRGTFALGYGTHQSVRQVNGLDGDSLYLAIWESNGMKSRG